MVDKLGFTIPLRKLFNIIDFKINIRLSMKLVFEFGSYHFP